MRDRHWGLRPPSAPSPSSLAQDEDGQRLVRAGSGFWNRVHPPRHGFLYRTVRPREGSDLSKATPPAMEREAKCGLAPHSRREGVWPSGLLEGWEPGAGYPLGNVSKPNPVCPPPGWSDPRGGGLLRPGPGPLSVLISDGLDRARSGVCGKGCCFPLPVPLGRVSAASVVRPQPAGALHPGTDQSHHGQYLLLEPAPGGQGLRTPRLQQTQRDTHREWRNLLFPMSSFPRAGAGSCPGRLPEKHGKGLEESARSLPSPLVWPG